VRAIVCKTLSVTGVAFALTVGLKAADGVLIVSKTTTGTSTKTSQVQIERTRMRTEISDPSGTNQTMVFDGGKQVMDIINNDQKTYRELTQADVEKLGGMVQGAAAQMNAAMANMTPAQRAQMEAMMGGRGLAMPAAPAKPVFRKIGTDKVGRWTCDKYEGYEGTQKTSEVCTVEPAALGFALADFDVTRQMAAFFSKMMPQSTGQIFSIARIEDQGYGGVPVRRVTFSDGKVATTMEITEVSRQTFPDAIFAVPAGFQKVDMMGARGRGRGER
jgi:Domain of unknown function (DUF4412)